MTKRKTRIDALSNGDRAFLLTVAHVLDAHSKGQLLNRFTARAFAQGIRWILNPTPEVTAAEQLERWVAISYLIRKELLGPGKYKKARGETAKAMRVADGTVSVYTARQKTSVLQQINATVAEDMANDPKKARKTILAEILAVYEAIQAPRVKQNR